MKGFLILLSILTGLFIALTVICGAYAHADDNSFLVAAHTAGYTQPDDQLLRDGYLICSAHQQAGADNDLINRGIQAAQRYLGHNADPTVDANFILLAETNLCPSGASS